MTIQIPQLVVSIVMWTLLSFAAIGVIGLFIRMTWEAFKWWTKLHNWWWALRLYMSLRLHGETLDDDSVCRFMTTVVEDWGKGNTERFIELKAALLEIEKGLPADERDMIPSRMKTADLDKV